MTTKEIFIDIDGTLLDYRSNLPESAVTAIRKAKENGHRIYLSTGRCRAEIYPEIWELGVEGVICSNGSYVEYQNTELFNLSLSEAHLAHAIQRLQEENMEFYLEGVKGVYPSPDLLNKARELSTQTYGMDLFDKLAQVMIDTDNYIRSDINKICFIINQDTDLQAFRDKIHQDLEINSWSIFSSRDEFGEIGYSGHSKASGIMRMIAHTGALKEHTIGFGDALNDLEMLQFCEIGVAMGNAKAELKEIADYVTDPVEEDGLYHAFEKLGLI